VVRVALMVLLAMPGQIWGTDIQAGLARVEITPPVGHVMGGYSARQGGSVAVHDPLYATALVLKSGKDSVAIVSLDLRSFPTERVLRLVREKTGIAHVMLCSTHTHSGPLTWEDKGWPTAERSWFADTEEKVVALVERAAAAMFPARLEYGRSEVVLGHNRRLIGEDGTVVMLWRNEERIPTSPIDPTVRVVRIADAAGNTRGLLVNYACHPVILGPDNRDISADWPGFMRGALEEAIPGARVLFLQGAAGDINPFLDKQPVAEGGFEAARDAGRQMADAVLSSLRSMDGSGRDVRGLQVREDLLEIPHRSEPGRSIPVGVIQVLLGDRIALVGWPGEPFVELQMKLAELSPVPHTLLAGYCYSAGGVWAGYLPTRRAAAEGGYGASYNTTVAVGTGERLVELALRRFNEMLESIGKTSSVRE
jgi:neutral ceramidase